MATLKFNHVEKIYPNNVQAVFDFNLEVADKEFIVFVGPSGCGKSTTLRMLAGLEDISGGEIWIGDKLVNDVAPKDRDIAMVFQNYALYPHMTIFDNMAFSLRLRKDRFPCYDYDTESPEYLEKEQQIYKDIERETEDKINEINNTDYKNAKKAKKDRIKELRFLQANRLKVKLKELRDSTRKPVMTYDHDKVEKLEKEIKLLEAHEPIDVKKIKEIKKEITRIQTEELHQVYEYRHYTEDEIREKILTAAEKLGLIPYLKRKPGAMSGGQRQRVALGRSIVRNPKVFLMDEPLSNLDAKLRVQMRSEITKIHKYVGATTVYVTHDQTEAMTMATRIVCMKDGRVQQIGTPKELFNTPSNMFVAGFIGSPAMNFVKGKFDGKVFKVNNSKVKFDLNASQVSRLKDYKNKEVFLGVRPEDVYFEKEKIAHKSNPFELTCDVSELLGRELVIYGPLGDSKFVIKTITRDDVVSDMTESYILDLDKVHFFDPETTERIK